MSRKFVSLLTRPMCATSYAALSLSRVRRVRPPGRARSAKERASGLRLGLLDITCRIVGPTPAQIRTLEDRRVIISPPTRAPDRPRRCATAHRLFTSPRRSTRRGVVRKATKAPPRQELPAARGGGVAVRRPERRRRLAPLARVYRSALMEASSASRDSLAADSPSSSRRIRPGTDCCAPHPLESRAPRPSYHVKLRRAPRTTLRVLCFATRSLVHWGPRPEARAHRGG